VTKHQSSSEKGQNWSALKALQPVLSTYHEEHTN